MRVTELEKEKDVLF